MSHFQAVIFFFDSPNKPNFVYYPICNFLKFPYISFKTLNLSVDVRHLRVPIMRSKDLNLSPSKSSSFDSFQIWNICLIHSKIAP